MHISHADLRLASENIRLIVRPTIFHLALMFVAFSTILLGIIAFDDKFSMMGGAVFVLICATGSTQIFAGIGLQRVRIDGANVAILSLETLYRWRIVKPREVTAMRLGYPGQHPRYFLTLQLAPRPERKWTSLTASKLETMSQQKDIDCPAFVAIVNAVRREKPGMAVDNLPAGYVGPLACSPTIATPEAPKPAPRNEHRRPRG